MFNERSSNLNEEKLKLDLYGRRYTIYSTYLNLLFDVFNNKNIVEEDIRKFPALEVESTFLFKENTSKFIKAVSRAIYIMNKFDSLFNDMEDNISALDSKVSSLQSDLQFIKKKLESTSIQIKLIHTTINNSTIDLSKLSYLKNEINNMDYHWLDVDPQTNLINRELFISQ